MKKKCVILISDELDAGRAANTAAMLGLSAGKRLDSYVGFGVSDQDGFLHSGLMTLPAVILKASSEKLRTIMQDAAAGKLSDCLVFDFSRTAQACHTYDEFESCMRQTPSAGLDYAGLLIFGNQKTVRSISGDLPLFS